MLRKTLLLLSLSLLCLTGYAQKKTAKQQSVEKVLVDVFDCLSNRDFDRLQADCTPDFLLMEGGLVWNLDTLKIKIEAMKAVKNFKRVNSFDFFNTVVKKKIAWIDYRNTAVITAGEKETTIHWMESAILEKHKGQWKMKVAQSTLMDKTVK